MPTQVYFDLMKSKYCKCEFPAKKNKSRTQF